MTRVPPPLPCAQGRGGAAQDYFFFDFDLLDDDFFFDDPDDVDFFDLDEAPVDFFFAGTFAPFFRAWLSPIATACFLLLTVLPDRPLFSVPFFRSLIAFLTFAPAVFPYFAIGVFPFRR